MELAQVLIENIPWLTWDLISLFVCFQTGKLDPHYPNICRNKENVLEIKWNPFDDFIIALCSEDDTVNLLACPLCYYPEQQDRLGASLLESTFAEKDLGDKMLNMSQQSAFAAKAANSSLGFISRSGVSRLKKVILPLYLATVKLHVK